MSKVHLGFIRTCSGMVFPSNALEAGGPALRDAIHELWEATNDIVKPSFVVSTIALKSLEYYKADRR